MDVQLHRARLKPLRTEKSSSNSNSLSAGWRPHLERRSNQSDSGRLIVKHLLGAK